MKVTKYSGELVHYDEQKLINSLRKSGADKAVAEAIVKKIESELYEGIASKKIYKLAYQLLKSISNAHAARYNLRAALMALGPAGFFFEKFIAKIYQEQKFQTRTNVSLNGNCISHEIDVLLKKEYTISMIECKFHSGQDAKTDVKVPMYILSRFNDVKNRKHHLFLTNETISDCIIVTNNRFTTDAIQFGECSGLKMLSWDYPPKKGIKEIIDLYAVYPITCLTTLTQTEKDKLLILDCITVKDLVANSSILNKIELSHNRIKNILKEANQLIAK
ncbi:MAG TPA: ATP cone domain-containing protein [Flavobacterium sp.]|uniref:restriction endonuclease n=1 Tax=Flavobacterium sp. TaxID=239 RepID=UPI002B4B1A35|nr:ATP cone domain-containing protein [Flavobacterium sp.]HLO72438.1 ATP cone domain-containing protein [Flavobacterium sp.]